jgi:hypothetical protein
VSRYSGQDLIIGHESELWIRETVSGYPQAYNVTFVGMIDSTSVSLQSEIQLTLYQGDVLLFDDILLVLDAICNLDTSPTIVSVLPLSGNIPVGTIAQTYALIPVYSFGTHSVNQDGGTAIRNDKELGLWTQHFVTSKGCDIPCSGHMIRGDIGFHLLYDMAQGSRFIYFEMRYNPYVDTNIGTARGVASVHLSDSSNPLDFVDVNFTLKVLGTPELYTPLKLEGDPFYCPFSAPRYYKIDFKVIPEEDTSNYCPQDTTGFFDFDTAP